MFSISLPICYRKIKYIYYHQHYPWSCSWPCDNHILCCVLFVRTKESQSFARYQTRQYYVWCTTSSSKATAKTFLWLPPEVLTFSRGLPHNSLSSTCEAELLASKLIFVWYKFCLPMFTDDLFTVGSRSFHCS